MESDTRSPYPQGDQYACPECGEGFDSEHGAKVHYGRIHASLERTCKECGNEFRNVGGGADKYCSRSCSNAATGRKLRIERVNFHLEFGGYPAWTTNNGRAVYVHQLVAITNGADPYKVFGNSKYSVDHINGNRLDNRHSNIRLLTATKHGKKDGHRANGGNHMEKLKMLDRIYQSMDMGLEEIIEVAGLE